MSHRRILQPQPVPREGPAEGAAGTVRRRGLVGLAGRLPYRPAIIRSALSMPTRAHQPMFDGSVSVVFAGVSPTEW
jgi:hypothetical protein